jgi:hypothetical protein
VCQYAIYVACTRPCTQIAARPTCPQSKVRLFLSIASYRIASLGTVLCALCPSHLPLVPSPDDDSPIPKVAACMVTQHNLSPTTPAAPGAVASYCTTTLGPGQARPLSAAACGSLASLPVVAQRASSLDDMAKRRAAPASRGSQLQSLLAHPQRPLTRCTPCASSHYLSDRSWLQAASRLPLSLLHVPGGYSGTRSGSQSRSP